MNELSKQRDYTQEKKNADHQQKTKKFCIIIFLLGTSKSILWFVPLIVKAL